jgi:beta-galactosidase
MLCFSHKFSAICVLLLLLFCGFVSGQVIFRELPDYKLTTEDHTFFGITDTRNVILLNGKWNVYPADRDMGKKVSVNVPSVFEGDAELIFEKKFTIKEYERLNNSFELVFLGLNYRADISINEVIIYRHAGGEFPFTIELSRDIFRIDSVNLLSVRLFYRLDSETTIPFKQRFLFPKNYGGILHDVYIYKKPAVNINRFKSSVNLNESGSSATLKLSPTVVDNRILENFQPSGNISNLNLKTIIISPDSNIVSVNQSILFELQRNKEKTIEQEITIANPTLWSPDGPELYNIRVELWWEDKLLDVIERPEAIFSFEVTDNSLRLNNQDFKMKGVTYIPEFGAFGDLVNYDQFEKDIRLIKETGFNVIRISRMVPHPYILKLCEKYGLFVFIELPIGMLPVRIGQDPNFAERCRYFVSSYISAYKKYPAVLGMGLGSSYLFTYDSHRALLSSLAEQIKNNTDWITFASFGNLDINAIDNIDMYGLELNNVLPANLSVDIGDLQNKLGVGRVFISEATYTVNSGNSDGYVNKYSYEAQAKYYSDLIDYSQNNPLAGYFINSLTDIRGDYSSLLSGYDENNIYKFGLVGEDRAANRIAYKVVSSKLNNTEKVTIPIGSTKDDAPMVFILFGLLLALCMGVLVNSGKKFREDASRALLRPYNYYADVRDQRIMSPYHTAFLGMIIVIVNAVVLSNVLFYLKTNVIFEKLLLSFGSPVLLKAVNYLCWSPFNAIVWITIIGILLLLVVALIIKFASFFIKQKVYLASIYFAVIWAFLPMVFLIPLGIVLYRVLVANIVNIYIYVSLLVLILWIIHRLLKGIYVIFDASPGTVYFYSLIFILFLLGGMLFYFEINNAAVQYILFTLKQYSITG